MRPLTWQPSKWSPAFFSTLWVPQRLKSPPHCWVYSSKPSCSSRSSVMEQHTMMQAAAGAAAAAGHWWAPRANQPPHHITSEHFLQHTSMDAQAQTKLLALLFEDWQRAFVFNSVNICWLLNGTEHLHILYSHAQKKLVLKLCGREPNLCP